LERRLTRVELALGHDAFAELPDYHPKQMKCESGRLDKFAKVGPAEGNAQNYPAPIDFEDGHLEGLSDMLALSWVLVGISEEINEENPRLSSVQTPMDFPDCYLLGGLSCMYALSCL
jgi:hypothetical protein